MISSFKKILLGLVLAFAGVAAVSANPALAGRWRLDTTQSTALDGWSTLDLVITLDGSKVTLQHELTWGATKAVETNTLDTAAPVDAAKYFRIEARHMAVYPAKGGVTHATATWIDGGKTLRVEADTQVEVSQGNVPMRLYSEYRVGELGDTLTVIELRSSRNRPLVYVFKKVPAEAAAK